MGFLVRGREQSSRVSTFFCMMTATGAIWLSSYSLMYCALSETVAMFWSQVGQVGINLFPPTVFSFAVSSLQADATFAGESGWSGICDRLLAYAPFARRFLAGVQLHGWGYYPVYDWLGTVFVGFFLLVMAVSLNMYWTSYRALSQGPFSRATGPVYRVVHRRHRFVRLPRRARRAALSVRLSSVLVSILLADRTIRRYRLVTITPEFAAKEIIDAMDDALLVLDSAGIVRVSNKAALRIFSSPAAPLSGTDCACLPNCSPPAMPNCGNVCSVAACANTNAR